MKEYKCDGCGRTDSIPDHYPDIETVAESPKGAIRWVPRKGNIGAHLVMEHWTYKRCGQMIRVLPTFVSGDAVLDDLLRLPGMKDAVRDALPTQEGG